MRRSLVAASHVSCRLSSSKWRRPRTTSLQWTTRALSSVANTQASARHGLQLRDYQEDCVRTVVASIKDGRRRVGVSLATGAGKTVIFTELIERIPCPSPDSTQTLILVHRRELVEQAAAHCRRRYPEKMVDIEMGSMHASGHADITIASVQSIISKGRVDKFNPGSFKLILVDEAHHIAADSYLRVLNHFGLQSDNETATPALVGVSATFSRHDGLALGKAIKHIVYHKDYVDLIGVGFLADVIFTTVRSKADISRVKKAVGGDFNTSSLSKAVNTDEANLATLHAWQTRANARKSTLVFCVDVAHLVSLTDTFRRFGIDARYVTGETHRIERSELLDGFKNGDFPVLMNCGVFTEGTDIPNIDCVLLARPTRSRNLLVQMIGRGMRLHPGKRNCHVIDMVSSIESGIVTTPTLFGLDPDEMVDKADVKEFELRKDHRERARLLAEKQAEVSRQASSVADLSSITLSYRDYDSVSDLIDEGSEDRFIRAISPNAWVSVGDNRFVLPNGSAGSYLTLEQNDDGSWDVRYTQKLIESRSPFARPRQIIHSAEFENAVRGADTYASQAFVRAFIVSKGPLAQWRAAPASEAQLDFLNNKRDADDQLKPGELTKGKAGDMITKMKFGARGRFKALLQTKRKHERAVEKEESLRKMNEPVRVGPVTDASHQNARTLSSSSTNLDDHGVLMDAVPNRLPLVKWLRKMSPPKT